MKDSYFIKTLMCVFFLISCKTQENRYFSFHNSSIIIENDSTLFYSPNNFQHVGGGYTKINYNKKGDTIIVNEKFPDSLEVKYRILGDLYGHKIILSKDSLHDTFNDDKYYSSNYFKSNKNDRNKTFYLIIDNKKIKITNKNIKTVFNKIDFRKNMISEIKYNIAKNKYGIDKKYKTYVIVPK